MATRRRASPMPTAERRASIVSAALPLLRRHGDQVTTAQIASAAGVAEGTLFRAFRDKHALISAAICTAMDPAPAEAQLRAIDQGLGLRDQLVAAVEILQQRIEQVWHLMAMLARTGAPDRHRLARRGRRGPPDDPGAAIRAELSALLASHRAELRCEPDHAARLLHAMAFAGTHPRITGNQPLAAAEIVDVLLDGIRRPRREETT